MKHFGLELEESKMRLIEFGRFAESSRKDMERAQAAPQKFSELKKPDRYKNRQALIHYNLIKFAIL